MVGTNFLEFVTTLNYFGANWLLEKKANFMPRLYLLGRLLLVAEKWTAWEATDLCATFYNENYWYKVQVVHFKALINLQA